MQAWSVSEWGLENLQFVEMEEPKPGPGEVKVAFFAASLNYRDLLVVKGHYNPKFPQPLIPCSDGYGRIVELGNGAPAELLNKSVTTLFCPKWQGGPPKAKNLRDTTGGPLPGTLRQFGVYRPEELLVVNEPSALTASEWATLPCAGVTAWNCLADMAKLKAGQSVLLIGTGGVALFGLQIAKLLGARVLLLSSSEDKRERAKELGADAVADYRETPNWSRWVREMTGGEGVDVVLETGGAGTLEQSIKSVKIGGHIALVGVLAGTESPMNILPVVMKAITIQGAVVGHRQHAIDLQRAFLQGMTRPVVHKSFGWDRVPEAFEEISSGKQFGKITIEILHPDLA